jgi:hypothetical protein
MLRFFLVVMLNLCAFSQVGGMKPKEQCNKDVHLLVQNGSLSPTDREIFYPKIPVNSGSIPPVYTLTIKGCQEHCGPSWTPFPSEKIGRKLTTWLVPILVLVGNMHLAALGYRTTFVTVMHLLGDPVDSIWSLLTKLEITRRSRVWVAQTATRKVPIKAVAAVVAAMEELDGFDHHVDIIQPYLRPHDRQDWFDDACKEAAAELADNTVDESVRTYLAILGYLFTVSCVFIDAADPGSEKPGTRLAFCMLFSWLIPAVMLSAVTRRFCSSGSSGRIMERFQQALDHSCACDPERAMESPQVDTDPSLRKNNHAAPPWAGAIYTYLPDKQVFAAGSSDRHPLLLLFFAFVPVALSTACACTISYLTPTVGIGCRSIAQLIIGLLWILSALMTFLFWNLRFMTEKNCWRIVLAKDSLIAIPGWIIAVLANVGVFNSCWCSSGIYTRGYENAHIALTNDEGRGNSSIWKYPAVVFANVGLLIVWVLGMQYKGRLYKREAAERRKFYK